MPTYAKRRLMKISIIIPTYNAENYLPSLLEKLKNQTVKDAEIIVIDSSSKDKTIDIAKKYTDKIIVIPKEEFDHGGTRTKAAKLSSGDIVVFLTQDALPYDEYSIENIVKVFEKDESIGGAYGKQVSYEKTHLFGKHLREFNYQDEAYVRSIEDTPLYGIKTAFLSNSFSAYRKKALQEIGWFKDNLILGEDTYAGTKLLLKGYKIAYVPQAKVYHSHSYSVFEEFKRYFDIGVFHKKEHWIIELFGKAEGEGIRYIKSELKYILNHRAYHLIPEWFVRNAMKYIGYKLGQNYDKLPKWLVKKLSMHQSWWDKC
jgi:rhamnosyltransferase